jgi:hypothetical protein
MTLEFSFYLISQVHELKLIGIALRFLILNLPAQWMCKGREIKSALAPFLPSRGDPVGCRLSLAVSAVSSFVPV